MKMTMKRSAPAAMAALGLGFGAASPAEGGDKLHDFVLAITGTDGLQFTGGCILRTPEGSTELALDGAVPEHREVRGTGLKCRIEKAERSGTITIEVWRDGQIVSSNSNSGSSGVFNVSVR
jgi:hypothetical protein